MGDTIQYTVTSGDSLSAIAKRYDVPDWQSIYYHEKNGSFRQRRPDPNLIYPGDVVHVPSPTVIGAKTGTPSKARESGERLLVDGHMHIQSNNCCPLPVQWGTLAAAFSKGFGGWLADLLVPGPPRHMLKRKDLNDLSVSALSRLKIHRFGQVGRLSTHLIGGVFRGRAEDTDMDKESAWIVMSQEEWDRLGDETASKVAGERAGLGELGEETSDDYVEEFENNCRFYYGDSPLLRVSVALTMDLSFSHYWGKAGLPIYLTGEEGFFFVNDFLALFLRRERLYSPGTISLDVDESVTTPYCYRREEGIRVHVFPRKLKADPEYALSLPDEFELCKSYTGRPKRNGDRRGHFSVHFEGDLSLAERLVRKSFVHCIARAPRETEETFEDYELQLSRTRAAAIKNPLSYIPFYHYDPRRHCINGSDIGRLAGEITGKHAFFRYRHDAGTTIRFDDLTVRRGALWLEADARINSREYIEGLLREQLRSNEDALKELFVSGKQGRGLFWGIKIYPRLGYAPEDFEHYPQLRELYTFCCADKKVPITTHCARGGMAVADYHCFARYDQKEVLHHYPLAETAMRFADRFASPENWEIVLKSHPSLKLNLAHFGGYDTWKECRGFRRREQGRGAQRKVERYRRWIRKIAELVRDYENVYTDLSYFQNPDPGIFGFDRDEILKDLLFLHEMFPDLKDRLIMGSDWYMIERDKFPGVGRYYRKMFLLLQKFSKEVGYDAWHQFSVINPLRFLGLIDSTKGKEGPFDIDVKTVNEFLVKLDEYKDDEDSLRPGSAKGAGKRAQDVLKSLENSWNIPSANRIKRDGKLLILCESSR